MKQNHKELQHNISKNTIRAYLIVIALIPLLFLVKTTKENDLIEAPFARIHNLLIIDAFEDSIPLDLGSSAKKSSNQTTTIDKSDKLVIDKDTANIELITEIPIDDPSLTEPNELLAAGISGSLFGFDGDGKGDGDGTGDPDGNRLVDYRPAKKEEIKVIDIPTIDPSIDLGELYKKLVYPRKAKVNEIQGSVVVSVLISSDGKILKHRIEGNPHLFSRCCYCCSLFLQNITC